MEHFCTLFDSHYAARALAMYRSLHATGIDFVLHAMCMDDAAHAAFSAMQLPRMEVHHASSFESAPLLEVKAGRTRAEYCWTCTPHVISHVLRRTGAHRVTYLDADLRFYASPALLLEEMDDAGASVLITPHRYTPRYDQSATHGIYCVQFMPFANDERGRRALAWWGERCIEWCSAKPSGGKFGDQKYLDDWPERFEGVHVLRHLGGGVAPWNVQQYSVGRDDAGWKVNGESLVFYHFHGYRYDASGMHDFGTYELADSVVDGLYRPYAQSLLEAHRQLGAVSPRLAAPEGAPARGPRGWWQAARRAFDGAKNRHRMA